MISSAKRLSSIVLSGKKAACLREMKEVRIGLILLANILTIILYGAEVRLLGLKLLGLLRLSFLGKRIVWVLCREGGRQEVDRTKLKV